MSVKHPKSRTGEKVECRWVPGTLDRIRLRLEDSELEVGIDQFERVLGGHALHDLYLKGVVRLSLDARARHSLIS